MRKRSNYKINFVCPICNKHMLMNPCRVGKKKYCSRQCKDKSAIGIPKSEAVRQKISEAKGGIKMKELVCTNCEIKFEVENWKKREFCSRHCSMSFIGKQSHSPWNKGLSPDDPRIIARSVKQSKTLKERYETGEIKVWNKGLTAETDERMAKMTETLTTMRNTDGEWKEKWRESMRKGQVKAWAEGKYDRPITSPEQKVWDYLVSLGCNIKWFKDISEGDALNTWYFQFPFKDAFVPDFACPDLQLIIEADGCAIHAHDPQKCDRNIKYGVTNFGLHNAKRDREKHHLYHKHGWKWANVWQCEAEKNDFHRIHRELGI